MQMTGPHVINKHDDGHRSIEYNKIIPDSNTVSEYTIVMLEQEVIDRIEAVQSSNIGEVQRILELYLK